MDDEIRILGLESSCDDTAAAVVSHRNGEQAVILSSVVFTQNDLHAGFGGVVPEIAARAHAEKLDIAIEKALEKAKCGLCDIDGIAVTAGPGLIGGVFSGVMCAKGIAAGAGLPILGINHLAGHALTPRLTNNISFPYLTLLVSGGHCQFLIVKSATEFKRLGSTIDDAPGEAFDKVARMVGLPQPGGPAVENSAINGDPKRFKLPRPLANRPGCDMSFSGLKTAVRRQLDLLVEQNGGITERDRDDICAGFQAAVCDVFVQKTRIAIKTYLAENPAETIFTLTGGVAANKPIRGELETLCQENEIRFLAPPLQLCTDNAAMIAWVGIERFRLGQSDALDFAARPRWPLDISSPALLGSGKKGAKA